MHLDRRWFAVVLGAASIGIVVWLATSEDGLDTGDKVASIVAAIHPAEPPPTTRIERTRSSRGSAGPGSPDIGAVPMSAA